MDVDVTCSAGGHALVADLAGSVSGAAVEGDLKAARACASTPRA
ncbi:MAG: hypothetical protein ACOZNI_20945 [Myxococcota bacterium]